LSWLRATVAPVGSDPETKRKGFRSLSGMRHQGPYRVGLQCLGARPDGLLEEAIARLLDQSFRSSQFALQGATVHARLISDTTGMCEIA